MPLSWAACRSTWTSEWDGLVGCLELQCLLYLYRVCKGPPANQRDKQQPYQM